MKVRNKTRKIGGGPGLIKTILENKLPEVKEKLSKLVGKSDVNSPDENGNTPLMISSQKGLNDIFSVILTFSPDLFLKNKEGMAVFHYLDQARIDILLTYMHNKDLIVRSLDFIQKLTVNPSVILFLKNVFEKTDFKLFVEKILYYTIKHKAKSCLPGSLCASNIEENKNFDLSILEWAQTSDNDELKTIVYNYMLKTRQLNYLCILIGDNPDILRERINRDIIAKKIPLHHIKIGYNSESYCIIQKCIFHKLNDVIKALLEYDGPSVYKNEAAVGSIWKITDLDIQDVFFDYAIHNKQKNSIIKYFNESYPVEVKDRRIEKLLTGIQFPEILNEIIVFFLKSYNDTNKDIIKKLVVKRKELYNMPDDKVPYVYAENYPYYAGICSSIQKLPQDIIQFLFNDLLTEGKYYRAHENPNLTRLIPSLACFITDKNSEESKREMLTKIVNIVEDIKWNELCPILEIINRNRNLINILDPIIEKNKKYGLLSFCDVPLSDMVFYYVLEKHDFTDIISFIYLPVDYKPKLHPYINKRISAILSSPKVTPEIYKDLLEFAIKLKFYDANDVVDLLNIFVEHNTKVDDMYPILSSLLFQSKPYYPWKIFYKITNKFITNGREDLVEKYYKESKFSDYDKLNNLIKVYNDGQLKLCMSIIKSLSSYSVLVEWTNKRRNYYNRQGYNHHLYGSITDENINIIKEMAFQNIINSDDIGKSIYFLSNINTQEVNRTRLSKIISSPKFTEPMKNEVFIYILKEKLYYLIRPVLELNIDYKELVNGITEKTDRDLVKGVLDYFIEIKNEQGCALLFKKQPSLLREYIVAELMSNDLESIRKFYKEFLLLIEDDTMYDFCLPVFTFVYKLYMEKVEQKEDKLDYEKELLLLCKDVISIPRLLSFQLKISKRISRYFLSLLFDELMLSTNHKEIETIVMNNLFLFRCSTANDSGNWSDRFLSYPRVFIDYTNASWGGANALHLILGANVDDSIRLVLISKLIEKGININAINNDGDTIVSIVLQLNNYRDPTNVKRQLKQLCSDQMVDYIVKLPGICLTIKNKDGFLPEHYASNYWAKNMYGPIKAIDIDMILWNGVTRGWVNSLVDKHFDPKTGEFNDPHNQIYCISCLVNVGFRPSACDHVTGHACGNIYQEARANYAVIGGIPPGYNPENLYGSNLECCARCAEKTMAHKCRHGCNGNYQCDCDLHKGADASKYYRLFKIIEKFAELQKSAVSQNPGSTKTFNSVWKDITDFARNFPFDRNASMNFKEELLKTKKFIPDALLSQFPDIEDTKLYPSGIKATSVPNLRKLEDASTNNLYITLDILKEPKENTQTMDDSVTFLKFKHRENIPGYPIKEHGDISFENLKDYIMSGQLQCPSHGFNESSPEHCKAYLYPDELRNLVMEGKLTNEEYIKYRNTFMKGNVEIPADGVSNKYFISPLFDNSDTRVELSSACAATTVRTQNKGGKRGNISRKKYKKKKNTYKRY